MTMEEILLKSDVVLYGEDIQHAKIRIPTELDARFNVFCVIKTGLVKIPGQIIIENIRNEDDCLGTYEQTQVNNLYILGLERQMSGYMTYANINPLQRSAFPATQENLDKLASTCDLDNWTPPYTGNRDLCPVPKKPRFCTKIREPGIVSTASRSKASSSHLVFWSAFYFVTLRLKSV
ncbi:hypothetical protein DPMN_005102 [Dreissena polymorpha]|uniref:Uncharacterized protein n=1 Tax=Dreissena polymorpha TaxID=45954 RepID=A0A9D4MSK8_DREPO|nr:hypothetical protein DPMN_005102 [Dreissena polymorpha]